ncbi:L-glutamate gamma-semialdehyde dehydrogenase [Romeria aff. gracilis LEGE 07310]|uniref:L-glutamate gamma-semialdehyde dehydrogenase n=1 Tax=Vasconcelosia minhoensis LEGE 07310 TaxID=915328 RepID=A0A8J7A6M6_9CYAN|nr:L-glutamate gamma-semialdehyde dehydrogenase [Romeria gracilis]MBE9076945.1 L-glutamate gamma-semialdehyde dehydrogenase [Romeria aff. gracilis LEGE 07310]
MVVQVKPSTDYEAKTQKIAETLLGLTRNNRSWLAQMRDQMRWDDKLLGFAMANPGLRVQLFRLIDCMPALESKADVACHLQEYLDDPTVELPSALKSLLNFTQPDSMPGQLAASTLNTAMETLAKKYIAGETIEQAIKTLTQLRKQKMTFTIDLLGEAVMTETEAEAYLQRYLDMMERLATMVEKWSPLEGIEAVDGQVLPQAQVSVKLTAFYSQFDPLDPEGSQQQVSDRIRTLLRRAAELGVAVHFDMEQYVYKDTTLSILKSLLMEEEFRQRDDVGITLQAYLRDSYQDLEDVIDWARKRGTPLTVRLIKGAYWDQETIKAIQNHWPQPVYSEKESTDANFERMTERLLENHELLYAAIGSHNVRSQAHAMAIAETLKIPKRRIELQVLYGMADPLATALVKQDYRVRVYCPYGELIPGMAYLIRRLLENTANTSFLRQNFEDRPTAELIASPQMDPDDMKPSPPLGTPNQFDQAADSDYAQAAARQAAEKAMATVRQQLGQTYWPIIAGEALETETVIDSENPAQPSEIVGRVGQITVEQAEQAIAAAREAFPNWRRTPATERAACLRRAADLLAERRAELCAWMVLEVGKVLREADGEVSEAIDFCRYYANEMERLDQGVNYDISGENNRYRYFPRGIVVVISPWNFPLAIATGMTVAALVTGNCTLLKPAETSSVIAAKLAEILVEAGIPKGVFQFVPGKGSTVGAHLVGHPDVHMIAFTGSRQVGCQIYADAAQLKPGQKHLKRVVAEMGGKNAIIVDQSADLDQAVAGVVQSAFGYSGQKCSACSRVIVLNQVYDNFVARLTEATKSLNVGLAEDSGVKVGPVIDGKARDRIYEYIEKGRQEATVAVSQPVPEEGYFVGPTVFVDVAPDATIAQEEIFGPVLAVIKADSFDQAIAIANGTDYALTGGLYSRTPSHIDRAQADFEVGNLYINRGCTGAIVARQPFGGFKLSGVGSKAGGPDYLQQFLEPRAVTENVQRQGFAPIEGVDS